MLRSRLSIRGLATLQVLLLSGCFDPPVREDVAFRFDEKGGVEVVVTTRLGPEESYKDNAGALRRLVEAREAARCGDDPFTRQLERLLPTTLRRTLSSSDGALRESVRTATFPDARALENVFEGAPLYLAVTRSGNEMRLEILPVSGGRATTAERLEVNRELDRFSVAAAGYLNALAKLWAWIDEHPGEERLLVGALLGVDVPKPADWVPDEREEALGNAVLDAMSKVHEFFLLEGGRAESLDELSRKAYDPFPAPLWIHVNGAVLESTGFRREEDGSLRVPPVSLWGALSQLSGRWVTPDPLAEILRREERPSETPPDVDRFLATGRHVASRPSERDVRNSIEAALVPAPIYRLRWRLPKG
ncbi:MAG TPA: hypothetical protein VE129_10195 [Thermoanaerobaculia bacterium]|nr:hypothetical protein [Thermoanaerobaculia bacterium]